MVHGTRAHAEGLRTEVEAALSSVGLRLNEEKTSVCHIEEGVEQGVRLHLASEEVTLLGHGQGEGDHETGNEQSTLRPPAPDQWRPAGLDELLPTRRVEGHLLLPCL